MNEKLITRVLRMLEARAEFWYKDGNYDKGGAYESAATILEYAMEGKIDCLDQFDYSKTDSWS